MRLCVQLDSVFTMGNGRSSGPGAKPDFWSWFRERVRKGPLNMNGINSLFLLPFCFSPLGPHGKNQITSAVSGTGSPLYKKINLWA